MTPKFTDPVGPGTPAWRQYDLAVEAWQRRDIKAYYNHRSRLVWHYQKLGYDEATIDEIKRHLKHRRHEEPHQ